MAYLVINGVTVEVLDDADAKSVVLGAQTHSFNGTPRRILIGTKRSYAFKTGPLPSSEVAAVQALVEGRGDSWSFSGNTYSAKGARMTGTGTATGGVLTATSGVLWPLVDTGSTWTVCVVNGPSRWIVRSDGSAWQNGVAAAPPAWLTVNSNLSLSAGSYSNLWFIAAAVPSTWIPALNLFLSGSTPPQSPAVTVSGDLGFFTGLGEVDSLSIGGAGVAGTWDTTATSISFHLVEE